MNRVSLQLSAVAGIAILLLAGCSGQTGLKALDRTATPEDTLPAAVTLPNKVDRDSSRLLATRDGVQYFAAESDDAKTTCLAVVPAGKEPGWHVGCTESNGPGQIALGSGSNGELSTILLLDGSDTGKLESGWTKIADNILVSDP